MKRLAISVALVAAAAFLAGPANAQDKVFHIDRKKGGNTMSQGTIQEESPTRVILKPSISAAREIPAADILDIIYEGLARKAQIAYTRADALEKKGLAAKGATEKRRNLEDALKGFQDLSLPPKPAREQAARFSTGSLA